jgi:hypothetical protein
VPIHCPIAPLTALFWIGFLIFTHSLSLVPISVAGPIPALWDQNQEVKSRVVLFLKRVCDTFCMSSVYTIHTYSDTILIETFQLHPNL